MTSHSGFFDRLSPFSSAAATTPAERGYTTTRAAAMASVAASDARTQGAPIAALSVRLRTWQRAVCAAVSVVAIGVGAFSVATPAASAAGASPWWHLDTSVRPAVLPSGTATDEVQQLTVTTAEHAGHPEQALFILSAGEGNLVGAFATEPAASEPGFCEFLTCAPPTAAELQSALEAPNVYGAGNVTVTEPEPLVFRISTGGVLAGQTVAPLEVVPFGAIGTASVTVTQLARPDGVLVLRATDLGNAPTTTAATLTATLPAAIELGGVALYAFSTDKGGTNVATPAACTKTAHSATCSTATLNEEGLLQPYEYVEMRVGLIDNGAEAGAEFEAEVAGGGADTLTRTRPLPLGPGPVPFGVEHYDLIPEEEGGGLDARAGSHPYQLTTTFALNQNGDEGGEAYVHAPAMPRNLHFRLPPGQIGNAQAVPQCTEAKFLQGTPGGDANLCPAETAIGVASVTIYEPLNLRLKTFPVPLFNLQPAYGEPVRFGFMLAHTPVVLDTALRSGPGGDYGVTVTTANTSQLVNFLAATVTFWGTPGDTTHDQSRGWACLAKGSFAPTGASCEPQNQQEPPAFLTLPTDCAAPFATTVEGDSWTSLSTPDRRFLAPFTYSLEEAGVPEPLGACNQVPFDPQIHSEPTSDAATSPTGLNFDIDFEDEGLLNPEGLAQSQMKKAVVTLPQGFTTNPSVAEGLKACSEAEYEASTLEANSGCTPESKVGEVEVTSPLVQPNQVLQGGLYVAKQHDNPNGNLLTLYLVARNAEIGVIVKQALKVTPNLTTGQLTTEVDNVPELPFSHFHLSFRQGQRSPLITPPACDTYAVKALLSPWSNPGAPVERTSSFQITQGPEGQPCPSGGVPPFHPGLEAGTQNNAAGSYSPFYAHITRKDSEQEITHFSIKLPPGVIGKLKGVAKCSDGAIAAAKAREREGGGQEELDSPSCPASSEIGHTLVGTGVGNVLAYAPGKLYLAGPYHGAPISIAAITAAKVGPFDLGTVVVREALRVNPETAEVFVDATGSDPIPHIVDGIPTHLRDIRVYVDRPNFVLNPTSCAKKSTASTVLGSGLDFTSEADDVPVTVSSPFQAADCAALGFKPKLALKVSGPTHRGGVPKFKATLTYPKHGAYANIAKSVLTLPFSEILEQGHIGTSCTRVQFNAGGGNGERCPAASIYGRARAVTPLLDEPLEGPVYLRSNGGERNLPDLVAALHGEEIDIDLVGFIDAVQKKGSERSRIRNTFAAVPDAPVEKFTLEMKGGRKGLLVNTTNICKGANRAVSAFTAQNGKRYETKPKVVATSCGKKGKGGKKHKRGR
jgi:hypothetical protein